jgi:DNA polymerase-3 subunit epsilon
MSLLDFRREGGVSGRKDRRMGDAGYVVIDTELTGLNWKKDSIVSVGAVRMVGGRIDIGDTFYRLVNPESDLTAESVIIHEIMPTDVLQKPDIGTVLSEFVRFCGTNVIVGYCVDIDMEFLKRETKRLFGSSLENSVVDIQMIFEWFKDRDVFHEGKGTELPLYYRLYDIAKYFGIAVNGGHNALTDAFITAQIFQRFIPALAKSGIKSVAELLKLLRSIKGGGKYTLSRGMSNF